MTVQMELVGTGSKRRIHLRFPYDPEKVMRVKKIAGARWAPSLGAWTMPVSLVSCRHAREQFRNQLVIGPSLWEWARAERSHEEEMLRLRSAEDFDLVNVPTEAPRLDAAMRTRPKQRAGARFVAQGRRVLLADTPGCGKTLEALAGIVENQCYGLTLIATLKTSTDIVWGREVPRWLGAPVTVAAKGTPAQRHAAIAEALASATSGAHSFLVVNAEMVRAKRAYECPEGTCEGDEPGCPDKNKHKHHDEAKYPELMDYEWANVILDETAHKQMSLGCTSANVKKMSQFRYGASKLRNHPDGLRVAMSGTPWRGKPKRAWGTLNWLQPDVYTSFWKWAEENYDVEHNGYGLEVGNTPKNPEAFARALAPVMLRRTKEEMIPEMPKIQYGGSLLDPTDPGSPVAVWCEMGKEQRKAYDAMVNEGTAEIEGGTLTAVGRLAEITRMKQFANTYGRMVDGHFRAKLPSAKFDVVVDMLASRGITGDPKEDWGNSKVVIASQYAQTIDVFVAGLKELGVKSDIIYGKTKDKEAVQSLFQEPEAAGPRVLFIQTESGGVSITLDIADEVFILDETWVADDQEQVENRVNRASRIHQVTIWYIKSLDTIDEGIARLNIAADDVQKRILDGSRGVEFSRQLLKGGKAAA